MKHTIFLEDARVRLSPLTFDNYEYLIPVASETGLVRYSPSHIAGAEALRTYVQDALNLQEENACIPFAVFDKQKGTYAGSTRYMNIDWPNKVLHIGSTWIGREFQGSGLNTHMKFLMLRHAFDSMGFEKVEFRIDERNARSRKAVENLGARLEGILRRNVYLTDGFKRNTCCYGILLEEWDEVSKRLSAKL